MCFDYGNPTMFKLPAQQCRHLSGKLTEREKETKQDVIVLHFVEKFSNVVRLQKSGANNSLQFIRLPSKKKNHKI